MHIGAGAFNRSHLAVYLDDLLVQGQDRRWGEYGVGLLPPDLRLNKALRAQDFLYGVWARDASAESYRVIGSLTGHAYASEQTNAVTARMASSECFIISMTVTEGGYFEDGASGDFQVSHPDVVHDLKYPERPSTWLGYVTNAAELRRTRGGAPLTLLSCDNLPHNGDTAKRALLAFAECRDSELAAWVRSNMTFPNSMVDRITPRTTEADVRAIEELYGVQDEAAVLCEPFRQWVLEDNFGSDRPVFEAVGAQFTTNVPAYEDVKLRLLNGAHFTLAYSAALLSYQLVADAMRDEQVASLVELYQREVGRTLRDLPGLAPAGYSAKVRERFGNPTLRDQVARICSEGTAKLKRFIAPQLEHLLQEGADADVCAFVVASWMRYTERADDAGKPIVVEDKLLTNPVDARALLGPVASGSDAFLARVEEWLRSLRERGVRRTLAELVKERGEKR